MDQSIDQEGRPTEKESVGVLEKSFEFNGATVPNFKHPERNEDAYIFDEQGAWAAVFDGVGGLELGDKASRIAKGVVAGKMAGFESGNLDRVKANLSQALVEAHRKIQSEAKGAGTTGVVAKLIEGDGKKTLVIGSVGDSRAYVLTFGELFRLTKDDSLMSDDASFDIDEAGSLEELAGEARIQFPRRNIITQGLGDDEPVVQVKSMGVKPGYKVILTSDGVQDNLKREEIQEEANKETGEAEALVKRARERSRETGHFRSHKDDMSAVVIRIK